MLPRIKSRVLVVREQKVIVDADLALVRALVRLKQASASDAELAKRLAELEDKTEGLAFSHDTFSRNTRNQLKQVFDALREW